MSYLSRFLATIAEMRFFDHSPQNGGRLPQPCRLCNSPKHGDRFRKMPSFHVNEKKGTIEGNEMSIDQVGEIFLMEHMLLEQLQQRPLLCDGAMGSLLYARGV